MGWLWAALYLAQIETHNIEDRTELLNLGATIENIENAFTDRETSWIVAEGRVLQTIEKKGYRIIRSDRLDQKSSLTSMQLEGPLGKPFFRTYQEVEAEIKNLLERYPNRAKLHTLGHSIENRPIFGVQINADPQERESGISQSPGSIFVGQTHAREHLSMEVPLKLIEKLLSIPAMPNRDIWIIPVLNPDGLEFDISGGKHHMWRKNRRLNKSGDYGVDLNRNFTVDWGGEGTSPDPGHETYPGTGPLSEPESQVIDGFLAGHSNISVLLSFHTFSELILYPWGHTHDLVPEPDLSIFKTMAENMATWNDYKPEPSGDLYLAAGDLVDHAYAKYGIYGFTFELSPSSMMDGGFYPDPSILQPTFDANVMPCLYMIRVSEDPKRMMGEVPMLSTLLNNWYHRWLYAKAM